MWTNEHPYVFLYLIGSVLAAILILLKTILFGSLQWITKEHILNKNLRKLLPPDERTVAAKAMLWLGALLLEVALSWINVVVVLWQIAAGLLRTLRELFSSTPEAIKLLRFPLRNNPRMSRESVWAYVQGLQLRAGERQPSGSELCSTLDEVFDYYPSFDRRVALTQLSSLKIVSPDVISAALSSLSASEEEASDDI
jgi:hypothetical protein